MSNKAKIGTLTPEQVKKRIKLIKRKHKLYVRSSDLSVRRLDKISQDLYDLVIVEFLKGDGEKRYSMLNADVKHWGDYKPIQMTLEKKFHQQLFSLNKALGNLKGASITVSYNGSWKPLARLKLTREEEPLEASERDLL